VEYQREAQRFIRLERHLSESRTSEEAIFDEHSFENSYSIEVLFLQKGEGVTITPPGLFDWNGLKSALTNNIVSSHSVSNMLNL